jgi:hypothetical protein
MMWVWLITQQRPHLALELRPPAADIATFLRPRRCFGHYKSNSSAACPTSTRPRREI